MKTPLLSMTAFSAVLLLSPAAMAAPLSVLTHTSAYSSYYDNGQYHPPGEYRLFEENQDASSSAKVNQFTGDLTVIAYGSAAFGYAKNVAAAYGDAETGFVNSESASIWFKRMTFSNPELTGQRGYATLTHYNTASLLVNAGVDARSTATYTTGIGISRGTVEDYLSDFDQVLSRQTVEYKDWEVNYKQEYALIDETIDSYDYWRDTAKPFAAPEKYLYLPIEFIWGETYTVFASQAVACNLINSGEGSSRCVANAGHSAYWGGVVDVKNEAGEQITDFSLLSAEGEDITESMVPAEVPEPASSMLIGAGLGMAWFARRRSRKAQR